MKLWGRLLVVALVSVLSTSVLPAFAEDPPPSVAAHTNKSIYVAGQTADVSVTVSNAGASTHLKVVARFANHTSKVLDDTSVYSGTKHYAVYMYIDTKIDVYVADATSPSQTLSLPVRAQLQSAIAGYYQQSGSYAVFATTAHPTFRSDTTPARKYRCIKHEVWRKESTTWKVVGLSACKYENSNGVVTWQWTGKHSSGVHYRVRARFFGDSLNHANSGKFIYFTFK
ncbi:hypothetical protein [Nocardioides marmorisolisilvae]|uniref:CARDB domain-containing protein n=1 Tax=Nocardioides marmorisolisilvae TaxID=1542737 RepID=A0A3N0DRU6_9ACTN|nr:hypothetical protein [Nocardioides marmorisolisilvae]RNL78350.1 hypothetical protein EFL95_04395 [Nocardioides marmorisolisilvae]